jgi:hypothetical protein
MITALTAKLEKIQLMLRKGKPAGIRAGSKVFIEVRSYKSDLAERPLQRPNS